MRHHRYPLGLCLSLAMAALLACSESPTEMSSATDGPAFAAAATASVSGTFLGSFGSDYSDAMVISQSGIIGGFDFTGEFVSLPVIFEGNEQLSVLPTANTGIYGTGINGLSDLAGGGMVAAGRGVAWTRPAGGDWSNAMALPDLGSGSQTFGANASGTIAGMLRPAIPINSAAFMTPEGAVAALWTPVGNGTYSVAQVAGLPGCIAHSLRSLNDAGVAAGYSVCKSGKHDIAVPFVSVSGGPAQPLPMGPYSSIPVFSVSQAGHIAGSTPVAGRMMAVLLWTPRADGSYGPPERVLDIASNTGAVTGVNSCGTVVGVRTANGEIQGFAVRDGQVTDLDPLPGSEQAWVNAINDAGTVVGHSFLTSGKGKKQTSVKKATMWQVAGC